MKLDDLMCIVHNTALNNGWWDEKRNVPELLCLLHSEISEALEAYRDHDYRGFGEELADIAIRLFDLTKGLLKQGELLASYDFEKEILEKNTINQRRGYKHGNKRC